MRVAVNGEITVDHVLADGGLSGRGRLTVLRLAWHPQDPLAVNLRLSAQPDHPALPRGSWVVLRDFLRYGLEEPTGDGVVRIWPDSLRPVIWLELEQYGRPACVSVPCAPVEAFLAATELVVPTGDEAGPAVLDALVKRLLDAAGPS